MDITILILTYNEEKHLQRCLSSVRGIANKVIVIDSFSTDNTKIVALENEALFFQNKFINQAQQLTWALSHCEIDSEWIFRLDADEYLLPELQNEIRLTLPTLSKEICGIFIKRRLIFLNGWIRHGGNYPIWILRIWRNGRGSCENRWMDEYIKLNEGKTIRLKNDFVDENLNSLDWWIQRQNHYSNREMIQAVIDRHKTLTEMDIIPQFGGKPDQHKRFLKKVYGKFPIFIRPFLLFHFNYFLRGGFLDGYPGLIRHFYISFWYRFLIDSKLYEIERRAGNNFVELKSIIRNEYGYEI